MSKISQKMEPYTMPISGEIVMIFPISLTAITMQMKRDNPAPLPPLINVNIAGIPTQERNHADPNIGAARDIWTQEISTDAFQMVLRRIAIKQKLNKDQKEEIKQVKEDALEIGETLPTNDKLIWFFHVAVGGDADMINIVEAVTKKADPQEDKVADTADSFPGEA